MGRHTRRLWLLTTVCIVAGAAAPAFASDGASTNYADNALRKLGRGIANIVTCPAELVRTPELVGRKDGYLAALSTGLMQGAWRTLLRAGAGVVEVGTFYSGFPNGFKPLLTPEFVYAHGDWAE